jgi:hypothetical protein
VGEKVLLPYLAIKHRFLDRPARCLINKQTSGYTYENGKSKNIQHIESRLGAYWSYSLGSGEMMLFNGTVATEILHRADYDGES